MLVSVIVPVYNESATVGAVIDRLLTIDLPAEREIIVVNDGSSDGTRDVLTALDGTPRLRIVHADRNRGKGHAIRLGLAHATAAQAAHRAAKAAFFALDSHRAAPW